MSAAWRPRQIEFDREHRFNPHELTEAQAARREEISRHLLKIFIECPILAEKYDIRRGMGILRQLRWKQALD
ncbi:hypothetical protein KIN20_012347 [Parelaphostrongylus tenuis]|uniref:Uncharacterized protein n=1 Tax=Parelaphostrongylus tenuis TaxID=148309 RepID=A0AAD5QLN8_PARTN|nr:hypothetical protein KIN20_012347 [Parelaphostrongylus tenuis]